MTKPISDREKAMRRAIASTVAWMLERDENRLDPLARRAMRDVSIAAHWDLYEDECECSICVGDWPGES